MGSTLAIDPLPPPPTPPAPLKLVGEENPQGNEKTTGQSGSGSGSANASGSRYSSRSGSGSSNRSSNGSGQDAGSSPADQDQDYSRSPLETVTSSSGLEGGTQNSASPFKQLGEESFLNPDITSASPRPRTSSYSYQSSSYQSSPYQSSLRSSAMNSRRSLLSGHSLNAENGTNPPISPDEARLMRHNLGEQRSKRKKWHNPILQQMEDNANPNQ
jgi:hypothetical protein